MIGSSPEPRCDIAAQVAWMLEPGCPKDAVFFAKGNEDAVPAKIDDLLFVHWRPEGTLITRSPTKLQRFADAEPLHDDILADLLGYPASKVMLLGRKGLVMIQLRDKDTHVLKEALIENCDEHVNRFKASVEPAPGGSYITVLSPQAVQLRRRQLRGEQARGLL